MIASFISWMKNFLLLTQTSNTHHLMMLKSCWHGGHQICLYCFETLDINLKMQLSPIKRWAKYSNRHLTKEDIQIVNKHMESCSTSYVIIKLQIKTMRYHHTLVKMSKTQNTTPNAGETMEPQELSFISGGISK